MEVKEQNSAAVKKSIPIMVVAVLLILGSVIVIQMISGVNLAQQGATDLAVYLKKISTTSTREHQILKKTSTCYTWSGPVSQSKSSRGIRS